MDENTAPKRRDVLKGVAAIGVGSGLNIISQAGASRTITIPIVQRNGEIIMTQSVPLDWHEQTELAQEVTRQLQAEYRDVPGVKSIGIINSDESIGGLRTADIEVEVDPVEAGGRIPIGPDQSNGPIPTQREGITIKAVEALETHPTGCLNRRRFNPVPGGVHFASGSAIGTSCCRVKKGNTYMMLTAAHLWKACANDNKIGGRRAYQYGRKVGNVNEWYDRHDWAGVKRNNNKGIYFNNKIKKANNQQRVAGELTRGGIKWHASTQERTYKIGISTGQTVNLIRSYAKDGGFGCVDMDGYGVQLYNNQAGGDSGGPMFALYSNGLHMIGIATIGYGRRIGSSCGNPLYPYGGGWPACQLARNAGFQFVT